jgi:hypothetical protein
VLSTEYRVLSWTAKSEGPPAYNGWAFDFC